MHHRDRIHRPRAYNEPGHPHALTFSCHNRLALLSKARTCEWLADAIRTASTEFEFSLWAYVFMPDHVHVVVHPRRVEYDTSRWLKRIKEPVSRNAIAYLKREAPDWLGRLAVRRGQEVEHHFWQPGRGFDRNLTEPDTLCSMLEYIHMNPVRKGLVARARDWKWSSAGWFEGSPLNSLQPDTIPREWLDTKHPRP
jgi:putative transposase